MSELIEQRQGKTLEMGGSQYVLIPAPWLEQLKLKKDNNFTIRLCKGNKGIFVDIFPEEK